MNSILKFVLELGVSCLEFEMPKTWFYRVVIVWFLSVNHELSLRVLDAGSVTGGNREPHLCTDQFFS